MNEKVPARENNLIPVKAAAGRAPVIISADSEKKVNPSVLQKDGK